MSINAKWFREQLADKQLSQRQLARLIGMDQSAISLTFAGKRRMQFKEAAEIARLIGLPVSEVLRNAGVPVDEGKQTVPLAGYVDGHGEVHCTGYDGDRIRPPQELPEGSTAVQCRTAGSPLEHMDGWTLFCTVRVEDPRHIPLDQFGVVKMRGGIAVLGIVRRGYKAGRWNVSGPAGIVENAEIEIFCPIVAIQTQPPG